MQRKRLMILGTNEYQNPLIVRAKELGYETHVFGCPRGEIGEYTADVYHPVDILDFGLLREECQKLSPCGVVSVCSEIAVHPMNFLLRKLGIPCNSISTDNITTNKFLMRQAMRNGKVDGPNFILVRKNYDIYDLERKIQGFTFPLIVKPCDLSSSRGVFKIDNIDHLKEGLDYAFDWSETGEAILEEYIEGPEYSGECIAYQGEYHLLAITEKSTTGAPHFVETGHRQPALLTQEMTEKVKSTLFRAFRSLDIQYGAIHPEFRITPDGRVLFMEIATRMGGDCIGTDLVPLSSGFDYMGMVINVGCGKSPCFDKIRQPMKAEIHYVMTQNDLDKFLKLKKDYPEHIWRYSDFKEISNSPVLKSADRAGYYITIE